MNSRELDKRLLESQSKKEKSWGKILAQLKRQFDAWAINELTEKGYGGFKLGYMPLLMNIHPEGITNNELAKKARVSKQAMSKVVKELVRHGYIKTEILGSDKRSSIIYLTVKGKKLVLSARDRVSLIEKEYEQLLGKARFQELKELLLKIIHYHDEKWQSCI
ncbi:MAG: MarR family winged helix-turn-helix transcriptional regulator [Flavisolibacter sp.]